MTRHPAKNFIHKSESTQSRFTSRLLITNLSGQLNRITSGSPTKRHVVGQSIVAGTPFAPMLDDFGTRMLRRTQNLAAVMKVMGHKDVRTAMRYQHPELDIVREALNTPENMVIQ